jgi:hypothetical protein
MDALWAAISRPASGWLRDGHPHNMDLLTLWTPHVIYLCLSKQNLNFACWILSYFEYWCCLPCQLLHVGQRLWLRLSERFRKNSRQHHQEQSKNTNQRLRVNSMIRQMLNGW